MNFLAGLIGGAAQTGANILERENKADYENSLAIKRQVEIEKLQEKRAAALLAQKRAQDVTDAKTVQEGAQQIDTERSAGMINRTVGPVPTPAVNEIDGTTNEFSGKKMTAADIATIRNNMSPEDAKKFYGIEPLSREQRAEDSGLVAQGIGRLDLAKDFRADASEFRKQGIDQARIEQLGEQTKEQKRANDIKETQTENRRIADEGKLNARNRQVDALFAKIYAKGDGTDKAPAEVKAVQWYIENKDDPVAMEAWDKVHQTKSKNVVSIASDLLIRDPNAGGKNALTVDKAWEIASVLYDRSTSKNTGVPTPGAPARPASRAAQFKVLRN